MQGFARYGDLFYNLYWTNTEGTILMAAYPDGRDASIYEGRQVPDLIRSVAKNSILENRALYSPSFKASEDHVLITYMAPIGNGEALSFAMHLNDPKLKNLIEGMRPPPGGMVLLADAGGAILSGKCENPETHLPLSVPSDALLQQSWNFQGTPLKL